MSCKGKNSPRGHGGHREYLLRAFGAPFRFFRVLCVAVVNLFLSARLSRFQLGGPHLRAMTELLIAVYYGAGAGRVGAGAVNCPRFFSPSFSSITAIRFTASSKPSPPNSARSMVSNRLPISASSAGDSALFHAGNTIVSSRAV